MTTGRHVAIALSLVVACLTAAGVSARTWHVPTEAPTIKAGLDSAQASDVVEVACGTYHEFNIVMKSGVTLRSEGGKFDCVTIDAQQKGRVFYCQSIDAAALIEGFTISGGASYNGAGMYCTVGTAMTVSRCRFTGNSAQWAAGIACVIGSSPTITHCVFDANVSSRHGGGAGCSGSSPEFANCTFYGNHAGRFAGAVWAQSGAWPMLKKCVLAFNTWARGSPHEVVGCNGPTVSITVSECDVYGDTISNWVSCLEGLAGINGNFSSDPGFCDAAGGDFTLCSDSWCLPGTLPNGHDHDLIGALGMGCGPCNPEIPAERRTWGELKAIFR